MFLVVPSKITLAFPRVITKKRGEIHLAFDMYKAAEKPILTPMRSMGQTSENPVFMRLLGGLSYYNAFLDSSHNPSCFHIYHSP